MPDQFDPDSFDPDTFDPDALTGGGVPKPQPCCCQQGEMCTYYERDWNEADTSDLGEDWDELYGAAEILDKRLRVTSAGVIKCLVRAPDPADPHVLRVPLLANSYSDRPRALVNIKDVDNYWFVEVVPSRAHATITLYTRESGVDTSRGSVTSYTYGSVGKWINIDMRAGEWGVCAYASIGTAWGDTEYAEIGTYQTSGLTDDYAGVGSGGGSTVEAGSFAISSHGDVRSGCPQCHLCSLAQDGNMPTCLELTIGSVGAGDGESEHCIALNTTLKAIAVSPCEWVAHDCNWCWLWWGPTFYWDWQVHKHDPYVTVTLYQNATGYYLLVTASEGFVNSSLVRWEKFMGASPPLLTGLSNESIPFDYSSGAADACDWEASTLHITALAYDAECKNNLPCHVCDDLTEGEEVEFLAEVTQADWGPWTDPRYDVGDSWILRSRSDGSCLGNGCAWEIRTENARQETVIISLRLYYADEDFTVMAVLNVPTFGIPLNFGPVTLGTGQVNCNFNELEFEKALPYSQDGTIYSATHTIKVTKQ